MGLIKIKTTPRELLGYNIPVGYVLEVDNDYMSLLRTEKGFWWIPYGITNVSSYIHEKWPNSNSNWDRPVYVLNCPNQELADILWD
jgi:hypothetical protein